MEAGSTFYRTIAAPKGVGSGHRIHVLILSGGRGFTFDVLDGKDVLIRRDLIYHPAPGLAAKAGLEWLETHKEYL